MYSTPETAAVSPEGIDGMTGLALTAGNEGLSPRLKSGAVRREVSPLT